MKAEKKKPAAEEEKNEAAAADAGDESGQADESAKAQEEGDGKDTSGAEDAAEENAEDADATEEPDAESGNGETADEETEEHPEEAYTAEPADNSGGDDAETDAENGTDKETDPAQRAKALDEREKALLARELRATAIEELAKEQLPSALADCFRYDSEAAFRQSKESVVKAFQGALKEAVDARLRGKPPKTAESAKGGRASGHNFSDIINKNKARR